MRQDLFPVECVVVYFYIISREYVQSLHRGGCRFPSAEGNEHICGGFEALGEANNAASVFLEMHIRNE